MFQANNAMAPEFQVATVHYASSKEAYCNGFRVPISYFSLCFSW